MSAVLQEIKPPRQHFAIKAFDAPLGAEVLGLDLSQPVLDEDFARLHRAHLDYHVLVFRDQHITPAQQVAFSRRFGPLQIHVLRQFQAPIGEVRPAVHPVVRTHPETGRKGLFVSEHFTTRIVGLPEDESRALLDELFDHSTRPEHIYRHRWQPQDMVFWDNRSLMHLAAGCPDDQRRKLYRTTIEGDAPF
jgi:alpha-ketoglutarate-dependent taurine dioxygenase